MTAPTTPFGFASTAAEVLDGVDLSGRRAVEAEVITERGGLGGRGVAPYALDPANAERLWELSQALVR